MSRIDRRKDLRKNNTKIVIGDSRMRKHDENEGIV
jgi:hypothetical protein